MLTVQDLFIADLLQIDDDNGVNETVELMEFMRKNATPLTKEQIQSFLLLREMGLEDIANYTNAVRAMTVKPTVYYEMMNKLTMADKIKGNAKLSHLLKANANPVNTALKPEDVKAKPLRKDEIDR